MRVVNEVGTMGLAKTVIYQYSDDVWSEYEEVDYTGKLTFAKGDIVVKGGKTWKVHSISIEDTTEELQRSTLWVYLVEAPVN